MGWIRRLIERRRLRSLTTQVAAVRGQALSPGLERAVGEIARVLTPRMLAPGSRRLHAPLVLIFARQRLDAATRLASSHWSSGGARNVGMDVLEAEGRARAVLTQVMAARPAPRRPLSATLEALDVLIAARRAEAGDPDGYGLATLHEIRRDLAELALKETGRRN